MEIIVAFIFNKISIDFVFIFDAIFIFLPNFGIIVV